MKFKSILLFLLLAALLCGCGKEVTEPSDTESVTVPTTVAPTLPPIDPVQAYTDACTLVEGAQNLLLNYQTAVTWSRGEASVTDRTEGTASVAGFGTDGLEAVVEEKLNYGSYREAYYNGMCFVRAGSSQFRGSMTGEEFLARQTPAILVDAQHYAAVNYTRTTEKTVITFAQPTDGEAWVALPEEFELLSASAEVTLDPDGNLLQTEFMARYENGETGCELHYVVQVSTPESLDLREQRQEFSDNSPMLTDLRAPKLLLKAVGSLFDANSVSAELAEETCSAALDVTYQKSQNVSFLQSEKPEAHVTTEVMLRDYRGEYSHTRLEESFLDGLYTALQDEIRQENPEISAEEMRRYCEDLVLSGLMATKYLKDAAVEETDGALKLTLAGSDAFIADIMAQMKTILRVDLDAQAQQMQTKAAEGYLVVDPLTGLPLEMGIRFLRVHVIDGVEYELSYHLEEKLSLLGA